MTFIIWKIKLKKETIPSSSFYKEDNPIMKQHTIIKLMAMLSTRHTHP